MILFRAVVLVVALGACVRASSPDAGNPPDPSAPTVDSEVVFRSPSDRDVIWDMAFLPDGSMLYTVRSGRLHRLVPGESTSTQLAERSSPAFSGLFAEGQSGLQGVAVDPDFTSNRRIYLYLSHQAGDGTKDNRVVRFRLTEGNALEDRSDIVTGIPYKDRATKDGSPGSHSGGRLRFGPDGFLYLTTGDNHSPVIPQSTELLGSKVLRFTTDGAPAPGNPGIDGKNLTWAMGFRNPQGVCFHPEGGAVFISEHGPNQDDEVTRLTAGANGGWNPVGPGGAYNGYDGALMTDVSAVPQAVQPVYVTEDSDGMSACVFLAGERWKAYRNRLAVGYLRGERVVLLELDSTLTRVEDSALLDGVTERVRSLVMGPDDRLYLSTDVGTIVRYTPR